MKNSVCFLLASFLLFTLATAGCNSVAEKESVPNTESDDRPVTPETITAEVKAKFAKDDLVKELDVKVEAEKTVVKLSGFVPTMRQKWQAEELAAQVAGVSGVYSELEIK